MNPARISQPSAVDADICASFDGRNYAQLASRFGITQQQVRDAVERCFASATGKQMRGVSNPSEIVKLSRLEVLRNATAWAVLRLLYPRELAQVKSAALLLIREERSSPQAPSDHRPGQLETVLLDVHPARPTPLRLSTSSSLGSAVYELRKPVARHRP